jgi:hypothetical protein
MRRKYWVKNLKEKYIKDPKEKLIPSTCLDAIIIDFDKGLKD